MPNTVSPWPILFTVAVTIAVIVVPGLLVALASGMRGWRAAGTAPLLSYAVAGLSGPWLAALGLPFGLTGFIVAVAAFAAVGAGLRSLTVRKLHNGRRQGLDPVRWSRFAHLAVLACLLVAALVGGYTVLEGIVRVNAIPQGWDAVYHGNAVRYLADTGDGSLTGTSSTNWYGEGNALFYPNAYHLLAALGYQLSGASVPVILNVNTMLLPGLLALSLVALVHTFRGRAVLAGAAALVAVAPLAGFYESMNRGPLLPFLLGWVLTPLAAVALHRYLLRPAPDTGFVFVAAVAGLFTVHSSALFGAVLFAAPLIGQRWVAARGHRGRTVRADLLALVAAGLAVVLVVSQQLLGAIGLATSDIPYYGWGSTRPVNQAVGTLLTFQHQSAAPQVWLALALLLGLLFLPRLNGLRWIAGTALLSGVLYVAVSTSDHPLVMTIARPWWDDPYRFVAMAILPLLLIAAHGLAEVQATVARRLRGLPVPGGTWQAAGFGAVLLLGFGTVTGGLYTGSNARAITSGYYDPVDDNMKTSPAEAAAMRRLGELAAPGDWAMNDRADGSVWTYALSGVRTVAGHFDGTRQPAEAELLGAHFNEYPTNPEVRAAVRRLGVRWVILGGGGNFTEFTRQPGLTGLDDAPFLELVYRNPSASIYRLAPATGLPLPERNAYRSVVRSAPPSPR
ncbi:DUF6541 family protein [Amycolatopsis cihanbeyliensis]|uniref:Copper-transporting ATPase n=1 Tax=Amycolatopsis cihanbeyliensis TaxID=1128664 RepID=A0A542DMF4_AMYCI|nr:DUF6541 family protein [Amycolatopsis cihanbeyliensis]TQJ04164.1 hypothetical protein FB471_3946 [Amycolatopsis cihanbeyliensis]